MEKMQLMQRHDSKLSKGDKPSGPTDCMVGYCDSEQARGGPSGPRPGAQLTARQWKAGLSKFV